MFKRDKKMVAVRLILLMLVILLSIVQRVDQDDIVLAGNVSECEPGGILFVPQFKPEISVMINVIIVGRSQILPP